jgi:hypothetical protein
MLPQKAKAPIPGKNHLMFKKRNLEIFPFIGAGKR